MSSFVKPAHKIKFCGLVLYYLVVLIVAYPVLLSRAQSNCTFPEPQGPRFQKCEVVFYSGLSTFLYAAAAPQFNLALNVLWSDANAVQNQRTYSLSLELRRRLLRTRSTYIWWRILASIQRDQAPPQNLIRCQTAATRSKSTMERFTLT